MRRLLGKLDRHREAIESFETVDCEDARREFGLELIADGPKSRAYDAVVLAVNHTSTDSVPKPK